MNDANLTSSNDTAKNRKIDVLAVGVMALIWMAEAYVSNVLWQTKQEPFVTLTWGHLTFPLVSIGLPILWFLVIRRYPLSYLGLKRAERRFWYWIAPLGAPLGFALGIPTYLMITHLLPALGGGGMAGTPPPLGYPLATVLIVEAIKYPLTAAIPHNVAYRGAVFNGVQALGSRWLLPAVLLSTALYVTYHFPFDLSFSAVYFNLIWNLIALFLLIRSKSLYPPIIFHATINIVAIMMSWGYYTFAPQG